MKSPQIIYGFHPILARLRLDPSSFLEIHYDRNRKDDRLVSLLEQIRSSQPSVKLHAKTPEQLVLAAKLAPHENAHQGIIAYVETLQQPKSLEEFWDFVQDPPLLLILDEVQDPHNLGACLRSADAFGVHGVIAPKDRSAPLNATVSKVACGAAENVPILYVTNLARTLRDLKERGVWILGADAAGEENISTVDLNGPIAWVLGAEGKGLRRLTRELCDRLVKIPLAGTVSSLNVSVATGICLYATQACRQGQLLQKNPCI